MRLFRTLPQNFFHKTITRCNRNFLIANLTFTLLLGVIVKLFFAQFLYNMVLGPFPLDGASLRAIPEASHTFNSDLNEHCYTIRNKFYFRIKSENIHNYGAASKGKIKNWGELVTAYYPLLKYGDKYLVVGSPSQKTKKSYKGILIHVAPKVAWEIVSSSGGKIQEDDLYSYMLSATGKYQDRIFFRMVIFIFLFGLNVINYFRVFNRIMNIKNYPLYKRLGRYGEEPEVIASIDQEVEQTGGKVPRQGLTTSSWIIRKGLFKLEVERNPVCRVD